MTTTKVKAGAPNGPEFVDNAGLKQMFSLDKRHAYRLLAAKLIKGVSLRRKGMIRGKRLWDVGSVRQYLNSCTK